MHWRLDAPIERIDTNDAIIILRENSKIKRDDYQTEPMSNLLRASIVMSVSALDAYFHQKVIENITVKLRRKQDYPKALKNLDIKVSDFMAVCNMEYRSAAIKRAISTGLGYRPLQNPGKIAEALSLLGIENFWAEVAIQMGEEEDDIKNRLNSIANRRHLIVHEGDISLSKKSGHRSRGIRPKYVGDSISFLSRLVDASETVIDDQLS
jgi:hypothetical protein